jgi:hypothetical protein
MIATQSGSPKRRPPSRSDPIGIFLMPDGRLPGFAQRRLDDLIAKKRADGLARNEQRELTEALNYIDAKTIQMLEHALSLRHSDGGRPKSAVGRRNPAALRKGRNRQDGRQ